MAGLWPGQLCGRDLVGYARARRTPYVNRLDEQLEICQRDADRSLAGRHDAASGLSLRSSEEEGLVLTQMPVREVEQLREAKVGREYVEPTPEELFTLETNGELFGGLPLSDISVIQNRGLDYLYKDYYYPLTIIIAAAIQ